MTVDLEKLKRTPAPEELKLYARSPLDGSLQLVAQGSQITFGMKESSSTEREPILLSKTESVVMYIDGSNFSAGGLINMLLTEYDEYDGERTPIVDDEWPKRMIQDVVRAAAQNLLDSAVVKLHQSDARQKPYGKKFRRSTYGR